MRLINYSTGLIRINSFFSLEVRKFINSLEPECFSSIRKLLTRHLIGLEINDGCNKFRAACVMCVVTTRKSPQPVALECPVICSTSCQWRDGVMDILINPIVYGPFNLSYTLIYRPVKQKKSMPPLIVHENSPLLKPAARLSTPALPAL